jgi:peptide/nickel transport system substrate-binding protein
MLTIALEKLDFLPANRVTDDSSILTLKSLVFEPLLRWQPGGQAAPALLSHWTHADAGRHWEFFIRDGAVFHDGVLCRPQHIIDFIDGILNSVDMFGMKWSYARYLRDAEITVGSANSIVVDNPEPIADILDIFCEFYICRADSAGMPILGTGPYRVAAFDRGRSARLRSSSSTVPDILVHCVPAADDRYGLLKDGGIDAAHGLQRIEGTIDFDPSFQWGRAVNALSVMYYLNAAEGLFAAPAARLAANHAVDKRRLIAEVFQGLGAEAATVVSPFHLGMAQPIAPIPYDPDSARCLLDQLGGPAQITLRTPLFMPEKSPEISRFVADALQSVGLSVIIETETDRPEYARQVGRKEIADMAIFDSSPQSTFRVLNDKISSVTKAVWWQGFDDAQTEHLIARANNAVTPSDREATYGACLRRLNANPPWLYLLHPTDIFAARPGLAGIGIDHKGILTIQ